MKKIKNILIIFIFMFLVGINKINAFSINSSSSVYVNSNIAVKIEANGLTGRFDITSSNEAILAGSDSKWIENETITMYFTAKSIGTATITVTARDVADSDGNEYTGSRSTNIKVVNKSTPPSINVNPTYNSNNYLKSLDIEGYELSPNFDKKTLEYTVTLEPGTETITINATKEHSTSRIKGIGDINVSEGTNALNVVVVAENGNERVYKIIATVEEKDPIDVKIDDTMYRVVKKKELLGNKEGYDLTTVKIDGFDIPALYNGVTEVTLIGLKNSDGKVLLFSYNSKTGQYEQYREFKFDLMNLYIHEKNNSEYEETRIKINGQEVVGYKLDGVNDYYLIYATNISNGYEGYYLYDIKENSAQRYDTTILDNVTQTKDKFFSIVLVLSCVCFLTMLFLLIEVNRDNQRKNEE